MYYLTVSVDQVSRHNLTGSSDSELLQAFIQVVSQSSGCDQRRTLPNSLTELAGFGSLRVSLLKTSTPWWPLSRGHPQSIFHVTLCLNKVIKKDTAGKMKVTILCDLVTNAASPYHCHILLVRSRLLKGRGQLKAMYAKRRGLLESSQRLPALGMWKTDNFLFSVQVSGLRVVESELMQIIGS